MLDNIKFNGGTSFPFINFTTWTLNNGTVAGYTKSAGNLTFTVVNKAGHMVYFIKNFLKKLKKNNK